MPNPRVATLLYSPAAAPENCSVECRLSRSVDLGVDLPVDVETVGRHIEGGAVASALGVAADEDADGSDGRDGGIHAPGRNERVGHVGAEVAERDPSPASRTATANPIPRRRDTPVTIAPRPSSGRPADGPDAAGEVIPTRYRCRCVPTSADQLGPILNRPAGALEAQS